MNGIWRAFEALVFNTTDEESNGKDKKRRVIQREDGSPKCTILVIDDDPTYLEAVGGLLKSEGFNVLTSTTGPKGLDMLRYAPKDIRVVLLDYNMPRFDGASTLQYVRKLSPQAKVFAVTGMAAHQVPDEFRAGADVFIQKPVQTTELVSSIATAISSDAPVSATATA